jgi:bacterioferritin
MKDLDIKATQELLSRIMEFELAGVVRYTHYSLMVSGPNRIPIVAFMKAQASESLLHAQQAGEILTGLGGHPTLQIAPIDETHRHAVKDILEESAAHESRALRLYKELLDCVEGSSVYLEEFARGQIAAEEMHSLELRKMLRDIGVHVPSVQLHEDYRTRLRGPPAGPHGDAPAKKSKDKDKGKDKDKDKTREKHKDRRKDGKRDH